MYSKCSKATRTSHNNLNKYIMKYIVNVAKRHSIEMSHIDMNKTSHNNLN